MFPIVEVFPGSLGDIRVVDTQVEVDPRTVQGARKGKAEGST